MKRCNKCNLPEAQETITSDVLVVDGFHIGRVEGIAAGTFFCFRDQNPMQTRAHVRSAGIPIRIET